MTKIFLRSASSFSRASAAIRRHIMLEKIDLSKKLDKKEYKALMEELDAKLGRLQRILKRYLPFRSFQDISVNDTTIPKTGLHHICPNGIHGNNIVSFYNNP